MSAVLLLGYMAVLFILSSIPDTGATGNLLAVTSPGVQNLLHIPAYALLALLWILMLKTRGVAWRWSLLAAFVLPSAYGAIMELYQFRVPGRVPSVVDFLCNVAGVLLCIGLLSCVRVRSLFSLQLRSCTGRPG